MGTRDGGRELVGSMWSSHGASIKSRAATAVGLNWNLIGRLQLVNNEDIVV